MLRYVVITRTNAHRGLAASSRGKRVVELSGKRYPVRITPRKGLRQVDFIFDGNEIRGLEQNPDTKSRWAMLARGGRKVMQFLNQGRYVANVVDGKVTLYGR